METDRLEQTTQNSKVRSRQNEETKYWKEELDKLLVDKREQLSLPPSISKKQRYELHKYAAKIGLKSKSTGKGYDRFLTVFKKSAAPFLPTDSNNSAYMKLSEDTIDLIVELVEKCPLTNDENENTTFKVSDNEQQVRLPFVFGDSRSKPRFTVPKLAHSSQEFQRVREGLPIFCYRDEILATINSNQVVVISGETGSGKSTQLPQYIMEQCTAQQEDCRIICTQPRRLAATSIADRISQERGDVIGKSVGYQIRLDSRVSPTTNLILTTSGYLLRCLTGLKNDEVYKSMTHLILDEVHEREKITDFLLIAIKDAITFNPNLKIILMSATLDSKLFSEYFGGCPIINVPGRVFDVEINYLGEILRMTGYKTRQMRDYMTQNKGPKLLRAKQAEEHQEKIVEVVQNEIEAEIEDVEESAEPAKSEIAEEDVGFFDECLDECLEADSEMAFDQIYYLITDENMPVDYLHSQKDRSALTIAAEKGYVHTINTLLNFGANPQHCQTDGKSALNYAFENNHEDCCEILNQYIQSASGTAVAMEVNEENAEEKEAEAYEKALRQFTVAAYQLTNTHPNEIDHELLLRLISYIHSERSIEGSILVFLPGYDDIMTQKNLIEQCTKLKNYQLFVLHSGMNGTNSAEQRRVFERPLRDHRKIILSTNIAETSLTINDVMYVIDAGKVKQQSYDSVFNTTCLTSTWISQACAKQRSGRAGRVQNGFCYRMYSVDHYDTMEQYTVPEILRVPLTEICLNAKILAGQDIPIEEFLLKALQPPPITSIRQSISVLKQIDALDDNENITYLGRHLADLPVDCHLGKCLLYSIVLRCLDPVVTIVAALSVKDPFMLPLGNEAAKINQIKKEFAMDSLSDHQMLLNTYEAWSREHRKRNDKKFCAEKMLCNGNMQMIFGLRRLITGHLQMAKIVDENSARNTRKLNENSLNWSVIKACLTAGHFPNICRINELHGQIFSKQDKKLLPHLSSVLRDRTAKGQLDMNVHKAEAAWLIHGEKSRISRFSLLRNITCVPAISIILFTGPIVLPPSCVWSMEIGKWNVENDEFAYDMEEDVDDEDEDDNPNSSDATFSIDEFISFSMSKTEAQLIYELRQRMASLIIRFLKSPSTFNMTNRETVLHNTIIQIVRREDHLENRAKDDGMVANNGGKFLSVLQKSGKPVKSKQNEATPSTSGAMPAIMTRAYSEALQPSNKRKKKKNNKNKQPDPVQPQRPYKSNVVRPLNRQQINNLTNNASNFNDMAHGSSSTVNHYPPQHFVENNAMQEQFTGLSIYRNFDNFSMAQSVAPAPRRNNFPIAAHPALASRFLVLSIKNVGLLYSTVFSNQRWAFNMPLQRVRQIAGEYPCTLIVFFYVQSKGSIFGAGIFTSRNKNQYRIDIGEPTNSYTFRPVEPMNVDSDFEMDFDRGSELYQHCQRLLSRPPIRNSHN